MPVKKKVRREREMTTFNSGNGTLVIGVQLAQKDFSKVTTTTDIFPLLKN